MNDSQKLEGDASSSPQPAPQPLIAWTEHGAGFFSGYDPAAPDNSLFRITRSMHNDDELGEIWSLHTFTDKRTIRCISLDDAKLCAHGEYAAWLKFVACPRLHTMGCLGDQWLEDDWIDAEIELPDPNITMLACDASDEESDEPFKAYYDGESAWWRPDHDYDRQVVVTHYRHLPATPKGKPIHDHGQEDAQQA